MLSKPERAIFQIPPDLVVKCQTIDNSMIMFSRLWRRNGSVLRLSLPP